MSNDDVHLSLARLRSDFENHVTLCDRRWEVAWKLAAGVCALLGSAMIAMVFR